MFQNFGSQFVTLDVINIFESGPFQFMSTSGVVMVLSITVDSLQSELYMVTSSGTFVFIPSQHVHVSVEQVHVV